MTKINHKEMAMAAEVMPEALSRLMSRYSLEKRFDPATEGGFLRDCKTGLPVNYIRSPFWRKEENDTKVHRNDIRPVFTEPKESVNLKWVETGGEFEMYVWDPKQQKEAHVMSAESSVTATLDAANGGANHFEAEDTIFEELDNDKRHIGYSAELTNSCIEMNFHHAPDTYQSTLATARSLMTLAKAVEKEGWNLIPIAAFPHRELQDSDVSQDEYVRRIAMKYMGWENVRHFVGSSFQVHVEMLDLESGIKAINMYQQIAPLLYSISLAGPFVHGSPNPNLKNIYFQDDASARRVNDSESYERLDADSWLSVRYPSRWRGSPSGGSYVTPLPENAQDFFAHAELGLKNNDHTSPENIPSPGRAGGHHTDRVRVDIGPNGTLEISNMDTFGGHVLKLGAIQEFTRVLMWKIQLSAKSGQMDELSKKYPQLFPQSVSEDTLRVAHMNSIEVAKQGVQAVLQTANAQQETAGKLFDQLLNFVNEPLHDPDQDINYNGLSKGVLQELKKSAIVPDSSIFSKFQDTDGVTSVGGFYTTGIGTLSHWLKQRAKDLKSIKLMSDDDAIKDCMNNLGTSYHTFLSSLNGNIKDMFTQ